MTPPLLANENIPAASIHLLRGRGHDVTSVAEGRGSPTDVVVLGLAVAEQRWILTFDRDYGELIFERRLAAPPAVILFRLRSYRPDDPGRRLVVLLDSGVKFDGQFVLVEDGGLRMRPLPKQRSAD